MNKQMGKQGGREGRPYNDMMPLLPVSYGMGDPCGRPALLTGTPIDTLASSLTLSPERRLLLTAGAYTTYRRAGFAAVQGLQMPECAPQTALPDYSERLVSLLAQVLSKKFGEHNAALLHEILQLMQQHQLLLPYELLPLALDFTNNELIAAVIGPRGRWLSQFNPAWTWVKQWPDALGEALPVDAENIWQEGTTAQRCQLLRRLRTINPAQAREWLLAVWKQERANVRAELLSAFEVGLTADDEPLLEMALDDRASSVRSAAALLLGTLPTSAYVQRMHSRAHQLVRDEAGTLLVNTAAVMDEHWARDYGMDIVHDAKEDVKRYITRIVRCIPPTAWEERSGCTPAELIALAQAADDGERVLEGWSVAAVQYGARAWMIALWDWWCQGVARGTQKRDVPVRSVRLAIAAALPEHAEESVQGLQPGSQAWASVLEMLPSPWSEAFSRTFIEAMYAHLHDVVQHNIGYDYQREHAWGRGLAIAARALSSRCLDELLAKWAMLEQEERRDDAYLQSSYRQLQNYIEIIRFRKAMLEEIHS